MTNFPTIAEDAGPKRPMIKRGSYDYMFFINTYLDVLQQPDAKAKCQSLGAELVTIDTAEEAKWIAGNNLDIISPCVIDCEEFH